MLKKLTKFICRELLKIEWIRREIEAYKLEQKKRWYHEDWAKLMRSGGSIKQEGDDS